MQKSNLEKKQRLHLSYDPRDVNNLFRLTPRFAIESQHHIYLDRFLQSKKFAHILLKEIFFILKPEGFLTIEYTPTNEITFESMEKLFWWLFRGNYIVHMHEKKGRKFNLIVEKRNTMFGKGDAITKWTFGIVTNGDRDEWIDKMIASIRAQKIPSYEIIICGKSKQRKEKDVIHIPFNERIDKGWITKKKNLIAERAKYDNLCVIHDRILLDKGWYQGMKKYGNAFELLGCIQRELNGSLAGDWLTLGGPVPTNYRVSSMHYTDWDWYTYLSGQLTIIKRNIWEKVLWDETRYWNDAEDGDISFRARDMGYIIRFNPFASTTALTWRHGRLPLLYYPAEGILPKDMLFRRIMRITARVIYSIPGLKQVMLQSYAWFSKTSIYKKLIYN